MSRSQQTDVLVVGGGLGGVAAALASASRGASVVLTEETDWLGGQMSTQAVPPDEHSWIETSGCTKRYREYRNLIRRFYRENYPLTEEQLAATFLNPGRGNVSGLCHEPRVSNFIIGHLLSPWIASGKLKILFHASLTKVSRSNMRIGPAEFLDKETGNSFIIEAKLIIDATELGDALPLADIPYVTGSEGKDATGEMHTPGSSARPNNMQAITWVAAVGFDPSCDPNCDKHRIPEPSQYAFWRNYRPKLTPPWPGELLNWSYTNPVTLSPVAASLFPGDKRGGTPLWPYRRILAGSGFHGITAWHDVSVLNWPQNDYLEQEIINADEAVRQQALFAARQLTLSLVYWLQNHAPNNDGGEGYSGIYLRGDATGTIDGLAKAPYIRESRRIKALHTVTENEIGVLARGGKPPDRVRDSVGIGHYRIDLHPTTEGDNYIDIDCFPFQIPLGALISPHVDNFLSAAKNIGTTHVTNGCFRLHPVEWNIGEAAGALAAYCIAGNCQPADVRNHSNQLRSYQDSLDRDGIEMEWPETILREYADRVNRNSHAVGAR